MGTVGLPNKQNLIPDRSTPHAQFYMSAWRVQRVWFISFSFLPKFIARRIPSMLYAFYVALLFVMCGDVYRLPFLCRVFLMQCGDCDAFIYSYYLLSVILPPPPAHSQPEKKNGKESVFCYFDLWFVDFPNLIPSAPIQNYALYITIRTNARIVCTQTHRNKTQSSNGIFCTFRGRSRIDQTERSAAGGMRFAQRGTAATKSQRLGQQVDGGRSLTVWPGCV